MDFAIVYRKRHHKIIQINCSETRCSSFLADVCRNQYMVAWMHFVKMIEFCEIFSSFLQVLYRNGKSWGYIHSFLLVFVLVPRRLCRLSVGGRVPPLRNQTGPLEPCDSATDLARVFCPEAIYRISENHSQYWQVMYQTFCPWVY